MIRNGMAKSAVLEQLLSKHAMQDRRILQCLFADFLHLRRQQKQIVIDAHEVLPRRFAGNEVPLRTRLACKLLDDTNARMSEKKPLRKIARRIVIADDDVVDERHLQQHAQKEFDILRTLIIEKNRSKHSIGSSFGAGSLQNDLVISPHGNEPLQMFKPRNMLRFMECAMKKKRKVCHGRTVYSIPSLREIWHTACMMLISITWARNEADIIESFVRWNSKIVDKMIVIDNASTDTTPLILQRLVREGLPLDVRRNESIFHNQGPALTELMHALAVHEKPDWILPLDADEFLIGTRGNPRETIETLSKSHVSMIPWRTYVPTAADDPKDKNILRRIIHRRSAEHPQYRKVLIPRAFHHEARIPLGSHTLLSSGGVAPAQSIDTLALAHFPLRDPLQCRRKIIEGWERHRANPDAKPGENFHWERLYLEMKDGSPTVQRLEEIARNYATTDETAVDLVEDAVPLCEDKSSTPSVSRHT